jgi:hypothetical protein
VACCGADEAFRGFLGLAGDVACGLAAESFDQACGLVVQVRVGRVRGQLVEVLGDGSDVLVDGPVVVVEDNDHAARLRGDVVQRLERDSVGKGSVAGEGDDVFGSSGQIAGDCHSERGAESGSSVSGAVAVVLAFGAEHEAVESAGLTDGVELLLAAGEQLVDVSLMADVEDEAVGWRVEDVVHCDGKFDDAEVWADVSAGFGDTDNEALANLFGETLQLHHRQTFNIGWRLDLL